MFGNEDKETHESRGFQNQFNSFENASIIQMRLDTEPLLKQIENFLSGKRAYLSKDGENYVEAEKKVGKPLVNSNGVNMLLHIIHMRMNHHVVQGNFDKEHYYMFLERSRKELVDQVTVNCYNWAIDDNDIELIVDTIMAFIEPFTSRLIDNKERESYMQQFQMREVINQGKGGLSSFANGIGNKNG